MIEEYNLLNDNNKFLMSYIIDELDILNNNINFKQLILKIIDNKISSINIKICLENYNIIIKNKNNDYLNILKNAIKINKSLSKINITIDDSKKYDEVEYMYNILSFFQKINKDNILNIKFSNTFEGCNHFSNLNELLRFINKHKNIKKLYYFNNIDSNKIIDIANFIKNNNYLNSICLKDYNNNHVYCYGYNKWINKYNFLPIIYNLKDDTKIKHIDIPTLYNCNFMSKIINLNDIPNIDFYELDNLTQLDPSYELNKIIDVFKNNTTLQILSLNEACLQDINILAEILKYNKSIKYIVLRYNIYSAFCVVGSEEFNSLKIFRLRILLEQMKNNNVILYINDTDNAMFNYIDPYSNGYIFKKNQEYYSSTKYKDILNRVIFYDPNKYDIDNII